jgi:hypothetical protein
LKHVERGPVAQHEVDDDDAERHLPFEYKLQRRDEKKYS